MTLSQLFFEVTRLGSSASIWSVSTTLHSHFTKDISELYEEYSQFVWHMISCLAKKSLFLSARIISVPSSDLYGVHISL